LVIKEVIVATSLKSEGAGAAVNRVQRRSYSLWVGALAAVIALAGIAVWLMFSGGSERPTLTFTGNALSYSGPVTFDEKLITFELENTSESFATFAWGLINDDSITLEDEIAWAKTNRAEPPWLELWSEIDLVGPDADSEATVAVPEGRLDLVAFNAEVDTPRTYVAALVEVKGN
jgi:hypothetical protein